MMKVLLFLVSVVFCFGLSAREVRVFSAVGGSEKDNYFTEGITDFKDAFESMGIAGDSQALYFGGPDRNGRCISTYPDSVDGKSVAAYRESVVNAKSCDDFRITMALRFLTGVNLPKSKDCSILENEKLRPAVAKGLLSDIVSKDYENGEVVYIHIADHGGDKTYGDNDWVINMSNGDSIKSKNLKGAVEKIVKKKDVKVQLSFDACYSGGFTDAIHNLKTELKSKGMNIGRRLCASSSTESKYAGYESDPLLKAGYSEMYFKALKKYGNQLSAVACASGADSLNTPVTTLDRFINRGRGQRVTELKEAPCFGGFYENKKNDLTSFINTIEDINLKLKIELLAQDFLEYFGDVMLECYEQRTSDQKIVKMIDQCLPDDHQYAYLLKPFLKEAGKAKLHDQKLINRYVSALSSIKTEIELTEYLDEFCCLAVPLDKSKKGPKSCEL